ncbi:MAG: hypothetical protein ABIR68_11840 [Ilumatobacteraceae bacterium]
MGDAPARDGATPAHGRQARVIRFAASLALLVVVFGLGLFLVTRSVRDEPNVQLYMGFAGDVDRFARLASRISPADLRSALWRDDLFVIVAFAALVVVNRPVDAFRIRRFRSAQAAAITFAVLFAIGNLAANTVAMLSLRRSDVGGVTFTSNRAAVAVMAISVLAVAAVVAAIATTLIRLTSVILPRTTMPAGGSTQSSTPPAVATVPDQGGEGFDDGAGGAPAQVEYGICCSGGGIRAAAYALGVLVGLEADGREHVANARYLSAVSGGNYTASGWAVTAARRADPSGAAAELLAFLQQGSAATGSDPLTRQHMDGPRPPLERDHTASQRHRYLKNGSGGLPVNLAWAAGNVLLHALVLLAFTIACSWPVGVLIGREPFHPEFRNATFPTMVPLGWRDWFPGIALVATAGLVFAIGGLAKVREPAYRAAKYIAIIGLLAFVVLVALPWVLVEVPKVLRGTTASDKPSTGAAGVAGLSLAGLGGWLWAIAKGKVEGKVRTAAPYLGGVVLGLLLLTFGGKVVNDTASGSGWTDFSPWLWAAIVVLLVAAYVGPGVQWASFRPIYTRGLRGSFAAQPEAVTWTELRERSTGPHGRRLPELIVCCAAQRVGLSPNGIPAQSFTITPDEVCLAPGEPVPTAAFIDQVRSAKLQTTLSGPGGWMAISGAAFASAMGRLSKGTTNAVLAGLGINLGVWLPSPRRILAGVTGFPRVRMGYYLKEIFGVYDGDDDHVFVADGGQWENLGLVELLRRNCKLVVCIDASGDKPGTFQTLREGLAMALTELDTVRRFDLTALDAANTADKEMLPPHSIIRLGVEFNDGSNGEIIYANSRIAADQDIDVRRFARLDSKFPHYSTGDQFLDDQQFKFLVADGEGAGRQVATILERIRR